MRFWTHATLVKHPLTKIITYLFVTCNRVYQRCLSKGVSRCLSLAGTGLVPHSVIYQSQFDTQKLTLTAGQLSPLSGANTFEHPANCLRHKSLAALGKGLSGKHGGRSRHLIWTLKLRK